MNIDQVPPNDKDAEQSLLGATLLYPERFHVVADRVTADSFYYPRHAAMWEAIRTLTARGEPVNVISILAEVPDDMAGPLRDEMLRMESDVPRTTESAVVGYAKILAGNHTRRQMLRVAQSLKELAHSPGELEEVLATVETMVLGLGATAFGADDARETIDVLNDALDEVYATRESFVDGGGAPGLSTGFTDLDTKLGGGFRPGKLVVLGGRPSHGKSALASGFALAALEAGETVLSVSLEMDDTELMGRMFSTTALVDYNELQTGDWKNPERLERQLNSAAEEIRSWKWRFLDDSMMTIDRISAQARRIKSRQGLGLLIVDYIQLLENTGLESRQLEVANMSRRLKTLSRELDVPIIALAQLNRKVEERQDKRPLMSDLRESGGLEQDADIVMLAHRPEVYDEHSQDKGIAEVIVAKHRGGPTGTVRLAFRGHFMRFDSMARSVPPEMNGHKPAVAAAVASLPTRRDLDGDEPF